MADEQSRYGVVQGPTRAVRDRGFSIVEVVVTITLMAVVLVPIMSAVATSVKSSAQSRNAAQVETALVNAADRVNRATQTCDYAIYAEIAVSMQGWEADRASVKHEYYEPGATPAAGDDGDWIEVEPCDGDVLIEGRVQRVTISVTSPDGDIHREIQVVKSDV